MEHECIQGAIIKDVQDSIKRLEDRDREDYGARKELTLSIKLFTESNKEQAKAISEMRETLLLVNANLGGLNTEITDLKTDVYNKFNKLDEQFDNAEEKNKIDIREIHKKNFKGAIKTYGIPFASIIGLFTGVIEFLKAVKVIK